MKEKIADILRRTIKTISQAAVGLLASSTLISEVNWPFVLNTLALTALMTVLMNLPELLETDGDGQ